MKAGPVAASLSLLMALGATSAGAADPQPPQPPMNDFYQAFYTCGNNTAFTVDYDSDQPTAATLTTSDSRKYELKRTAPNAMSFTSGAVRLTVTGKRATVEGARQAVTDCSTKVG